MGLVRYVFLPNITVHLKFYEILRTKKTSITSCRLTFVFTEHHIFGQLEVDP